MCHVLGARRFMGYALRVWGFRDYKLRVLWVSGFRG